MFSVQRFSSASICAVPVVHRTWVSVSSYFNSVVTHQTVHAGNKERGMRLRRQSCSFHSKAAGRTLLALQRTRENFEICTDIPVLLVQELLQLEIICTSRKQIRANLRPTKWAAKCGGPHLTKSGRGLKRTRTVLPNGGSAE